MTAMSYAKQIVKTTAFAAIGLWALGFIPGSARIKQMIFQGR